MIGIVSAGGNIKLLQTEASTLDRDKRSETEVGHCTLFMHLLSRRRKKKAAGCCHTVSTSQTPGRTVKLLPVIPRLSPCPVHVSPFKILFSWKLEFSRIPHFSLLNYSEGGKTNASPLYLFCKLFCWRPSLSFPPLHFFVFFDSFYVLWFHHFSVFIYPSLPFQTYIL